MRIQASTLLMIALTGAVPAAAATVYPLQSAQVAQALSSVGVSVNPSEVNLVAEVVALEPNAKLDVLDVQRPAASNSDQAWVKLGCHDAGTCMPFYAVVKWSGSVSAIPVQKRINAQHFSPASPIAIHVGQHITLDIERERSRIEVAVVSLENGAVGQIIRVATPDRKQVFHAEVVSSAIVKGSL